MRQLSELAHEYTAMGVLGPIQLIGRRRDEYPLVQDTVTHLDGWSYAWYTVPRCLVCPKPTCIGCHLVDY